MGANTTAAVSIVPDALSHFAVVRPDVEITVFESDPLISLARLCGRELDLAIVFEYDHVPLPDDLREWLRQFTNEHYKIEQPRRQRAQSFLSVQEREQQARDLLERGRG